MEPTIYKPSIYNGNGVYKNGSAGGGGGGTIDIENMGLYLHSTDNYFDLPIGDFRTGSAHINICCRYIENSETARAVFELLHDNNTGYGFISIRNGSSSTSIYSKWGAGEAYEFNKAAGNINNSPWNVMARHKDYSGTGHAMGVYNQYVGYIDSYSFGDNDVMFNKIRLYMQYIEFYFIRVKDSQKELLFYPYKNEGITNGFIEKNSGEFYEVQNSFILPLIYS